MIRLVLVLALLGGARLANAHDLRPGVLALAEHADGSFALRFVAPVDSRGEARDLRIVLPPGCTASEARVTCAHGLVGELGVLGMRDGPMKTIVTLATTEGEHAEWILTARTPTITLSRAAPPPRAAGPWIGIGIEHILGGPDHLAFVIGLLLVLELRLDRRLFAALTAFTLAHSLTLALAALRIVNVSIPPVEACIAASVLLVAREATHRRPTAVRRWPYLAAAIFGLVHGLGFAAALGELALPRGALVWSLAWFNVGVELGQLAVVAIAVAGVWIWRRAVRERPRPAAFGPRIHRVLCYILGGLAGWWFIDRIV